MAYKWKVSEEMTISEVGVSNGEGAVTHYEFETPVIVQANEPIEMALGRRICELEALIKKAPETGA